MISLIFGLGGRILGLFTTVSSERYNVPSSLQVLGATGDYDLYSHCAASHHRVRYSMVALSIEILLLMSI